MGWGSFLYRFSRSILVSPFSNQNWTVIVHHHLFQGVVKLFVRFAFTRKDRTAVVETDPVHLAEP